MCCECKGPKSDFSLLKETLDTYAKVPGSLITILQKAQDIYGYLPKDVMYHIAEACGTTPAEVVGGDKVEAMKFTGRDGVSEATIACDTVVFAIGQAAEDMTAVVPVAVNDKGLIVTTGSKTNVAGIFAAGDVAHGGKTVVEAVAAGKIAAVEIMDYLK